MVKQSILCFLLFVGGRKMCGGKGEKVKKVMSFKHVLDSFDEMQALISRKPMLLRVVEESKASGAELRHRKAAMGQQVEP